MNAGWCLILSVALAWLPTIAMAAPLARYVVGVENIDYRPFQRGDEGTLKGFGRDLLDAFAAAEGIAFDYKPMPPPRLLASLLRGHVDFKYPDDPDWQPASRQGRDIHYSRPIIGYLDGTLVAPANQGRPASAIATLGTVIGFTPLAWLERLREGRVALRENADFDALFQQVLSQRLDAAYANVAVANAQSQRILGRPDALLFDPSLPCARGEYRLSTLKHADVLARFDRWLAEHAAHVTALKRRHGLAADPPG